MNDTQIAPSKSATAKSATSLAKSIVTVALIFMWAILLAVLMIRMPMADLLAGLNVLTVDIVLSACFIAVGVASAICGLCFGSKPLMLLSLLQSAFLLCFALSICLYLVFFNGDILAVGLYFVNPFAALLSCRFSIFLTVSVLLIVFPLVVFLLYAWKNKKHRAQKKRFRA